MEEIISFPEENSSINKTKVIKEKILFFSNIKCIEKIKYNNKEYYSVGISDEGSKSVIEIYDYYNFELIGSTELDYQKIEYITQIFSHNLLVSGTNLRIFTFYLDNNIFRIILIQQIGIPFHTKTYKYCSKFGKPFIFDINLYRENGDVPVKEDILIVSTISGIYLYSKKAKNGKIDNAQFNHKDYLDDWNDNPFIYKDQIFDESNYDAIQVNFEYIAIINTKGCVCLYCMATKEIVTIFEINNSTEEYYISMLNKDILCVGGYDTLSLISIKDFEIIHVHVIKPQLLITGICIINEKNILIAVNNDNEKQLIHYKYNFEKDILSKKSNHNITQISSELITNKKGNLKMLSVDKNHFIIIVGEHAIQLREINNSNF